MEHSTRNPERPINLYRQRGDREVWDRAQKDADAADRSLSRHVVAVLREHQERRPVALEATCPKCGETFNPADETDTEHVWNVERDERCGGQGEITGEWR